MSTTEPLDLQTMVEPLKNAIEVLGTEIAELEASTKEKREQRVKYRNVLRGLDPLAVEPLYKLNGAKAKKKPYASRNRGAVRQDEVTQWLQDNREWINAGEGITSTGLSRDERFPMYGHGQQSAISKILILLQDKGVIRLDHIGKLGGSKHFKVV